MRRILKEVAPISQDQILNEVLNPLKRHQNALNAFQPSNNMKTLSCTPNKHLHLNASPTMRPINLGAQLNLQETGHIGSYSEMAETLPQQITRDLNNQSGVSQCLFPNQLNNSQRLAPNFQLLAIQEQQDEDDLNNSPAIQDARMGTDSESEEQVFDDMNLPKSRIQLNQIKKVNHYHNKSLDFNQIIKENGCGPQYLQNTHIDNLEGLQNQQLLQDAHYMDNMTVRSSIANFTQQPDDFMHVKKFAHINTTYNKEAQAGNYYRMSEDRIREADSDYESENGQMDCERPVKYQSAIFHNTGGDQPLMTHQNNPQNNSKRKQNREQDAQQADIDSIIMSESLDQMLEETPNHIIYNQQQHQNKRRLEEPANKSPQNFKEQQQNDKNKEQQNITTAQPSSKRSNNFLPPISPNLLGKPSEVDNEGMKYNNSLKFELANSQLAQQILQQNILNNLIANQFAYQNINNQFQDTPQELLQEQFGQITQIDQVDQQIQALTEQLQLHHADYCQTIEGEQKEKENEVYLKNRQQFEKMEVEAQTKKMKSQVPQIRKASKGIKKKDFDTLSHGSSRSKMSGNTKNKVLSLVQVSDQKAMEKDEELNKDQSMAIESNEDTAEKVTVKETKLEQQDPNHQTTKLVDQNELNFQMKMIGPLTMRQRHEKIVKYMMKKRMKGQGKKFTYECRKQVAEKRLRIKGRFVTKDQAFEILGLKKDDLRTTDCLQKLLEQHYNINQMQQYNTEVPYTSHIAQIMRHQLSQQNGAIQVNIGPQQAQNRLNSQNKNMLQLNSLVQNEKGESKMVKIRNFQALFENFIPRGNNESSNAMMAGSNDPQSSSNDPVPEHGFDSLSKQSSEIKDIYTLQNQSLEYHFKQNHPLTSVQDSFKYSQHPNMDMLSRYRQQQLSLLDLQEALQKQESQNGGDIVTFENYIQPLFKIERVVRFNNEDKQSMLDEVFE